MVVKGSPAALAGLRFGDQILQVNGIIVAGYTMDQVHKLFKDSPINGISVVVRDRYDVFMTVCERLTYSSCKHQL